MKIITLDGASVEIQPKVILELATVNDARLVGESITGDSVPLTDFIQPDIAEKYAAAVFFALCCSRDVFDLREVNTTKRPFKIIDFNNFAETIGESVINVEAISKVKTLDAP